MKQEYVNRIRAFNRYYTKLLGVLNKYYLGSEFGLPEVRILQDVYLHPDRSSKDISGELNMDKGLLSRLLKQLEQKGYIYRKGTERDNRMGLINLTEKGREIYHRLDVAANESVEKIFAHLNDSQLQELINNMDSICNTINEMETTFAAKSVEPIVICPIAEEDNTSIARVLRASVEEHDAPKVGTFYDDPHTDRMFQTFDRKDAEYWVVKCNGVILGGGGFYPTKGLSTGYAELSKFHFSPELRGKGVGKRLLQLIEQRAIKAGYTHLYLVSYHQFGNAVAMYEKYGYEHISGALDQSGMYQDAPFHLVKELAKKATAASAQDIEITPYEPRYQEAFKSLNEEWINQYFKMEESDYAALNNPQELILDKGGEIFVALYKNEPVGVCALIKINDEQYDYELSKLAVSPNVQGKGIGLLLGQAVINKAKESGGRNLYLESNTVLEPAIRLYEKLGFKKVVGHGTSYRRCNIQMELAIK